MTKHERVATEIAEYEQKMFGPINRGFAGPDKLGEVRAIAAILAARYGEEERLREAAAKLFRLQEASGGWFAHPELMEEIKAMIDPTEARDA